MGLTPRQIDALTLPELAAMFDGFRRFHSGKDEADEPDEPDMDEFYRALAEAKANGQA